jgi:hypothetical protein
MDSLVVFAIKATDETVEIVEPLADLAAHLAEARPAQAAQGQSTSRLFMPAMVGF